MRGDIGFDAFDGVQEGSHEAQAGFFGSQFERHLLIKIIYNSMNDTGNSFGSNPASLKGKLQTLEVQN